MLRTFSSVGTPIAHSKNLEVSSQMDRRATQAQLLRQRKGSTNGTGGVVKVEPEGDAKTGAAKIGDQESTTGDGAGSGAGSASCSRAVNRALMQAASERTGHSHCDSKSDWTR